MSYPSQAYVMGYVPIAGDRYTLPARDMVSSEVETLAELNMLEGMIMLASCDKVVPE